nr:VTT domain-containing protein [Methylacidiphilum caldifontis]
MDFIFHWDHYLREIIITHKEGIYLLLFALIFCETGLIFTPFLPGDSLLFTLGIFAAEGWLNIYYLFVFLSLAAIGGDNINYFVGHRLGKMICSVEKFFLIKKEHIHKTEKFFVKFGAKAVFLSRFIPIIRTFTPFVAGVGSMSYGRFVFYNISGGICWISLFLGLGFFLGNQPIIKNNIKICIYVIIFVSVLPLIIEWIKSSFYSKVGRFPISGSKK